MWFITWKGLLISTFVNMIPYSNNTPEELWARQQIDSNDVDYSIWNKKRESLKEFSHISQSCIFTVDVFKKRYDFASDNFSTLFGYDPLRIRTIRKQGDMLEDMIHSDDREQLIKYQVEHGQFIYSLPQEERNDYQQIFQFRVLNAGKRYVNVISRHHVIQKDRNGKAWIIMGNMDIAADQSSLGTVKRIVLNKKTGELVRPVSASRQKLLTGREREVLLMIRRGLFSKEIADRMNLSLYTVNNHRKNILAKLGADNIMEAINIAHDYGILS